MAYNLNKQCAAPATIKLYYKAQPLWSYQQPKTNFA